MITFLCTIAGLAIVGTHYGCYRLGQLSKDK